MSEHDRGAYTPNNDAPLSFDARQSRGRRAFPTTLLISLLILIGLTLAIAMFYRSGVRGAGQAPVPVGTPVGEIKSPPPAQTQQQQDPGQGLQIYKAEGAPASSVPATGFAPPPEQPQARPTVPVTAQPIAPAKPAAATPAPVAVAATPPSAPKPAPVQAAPAKPPVATAKPPARDEIAALLDAKPAAKPQAKAAPAPAANTAHGAAVVQFGAFSSTDLAGSEWAKLAKAYPSEMAGKGKLVESVARDGKTLFRGAVSGFASRTDAVAFCAKLKADGKACIVR